MRTPTRIRIRTQIRFPYRFRSATWALCASKWRCRLRACRVHFSNHIHCGFNRDAVDRGDGDAELFERRQSLRDRRVSPILSPQLRVGLASWGPNTFATSWQNLRFHEGEDRGFVPSGDWYLRGEFAGVGIASPANIQYQGDLTALRAP